MGAVIVTVTPSDNDLREETPVSLERAKPKPISYIKGAARGDGWGWSGHGDDNIT